MPNWCANTLKLEHTDPKMIARAKKAFAKGEFCQEFRPCPPELKDTTSPNRDAAQAEKLMLEHGYADWYSFNVTEWGTKWDFGSKDGISKSTKTTLVLNFDSAWSPPLAMMEVLESEGFTVVLDYYEPGMNFVGRYSDGYDESYECDDCPEDMDEMWSISEMRESMEDEEE